MERPFCIIFAGAVGSSKTPIATYLSHNLGLPVFNNDAIRSEVIEDYGEWRKDIYVERKNTRAIKILRSGRSFIYDASIDRQWRIVNEWLQEYRFTPFVISMDLSMPFLRKLYEAKWYSRSLEKIEVLLSDHNRFLAEYPHPINIRISDKDFPDRLSIALCGVQDWFSSH